MKLRDNETLFAELHGLRGVFGAYVSAKRIRLALDAVERHLAVSDNGDPWDAEGKCSFCEERRPCVRGETANICAGCASFAVDMLSADAATPPGTPGDPREKGPTE